MEMKYATPGTRVAYYNGVSDEYGRITDRSSLDSYIFVQFDGDTHAKLCYVSTLALVPEPEVEDTGSMTNAMDDAFDPVIRHNRFKNFEEETAGNILDDEQIYQRGFDDALFMLTDALAALKNYEMFGELHQIKQDARRSEILMEHINSQPAPVKQAWKKHLSEKKAL